MGWCPCHAGCLNTEPPAVRVRRLILADGKETSELCPPICLPCRALAQGQPWAETLPTSAPSPPFSELIPLLGKGRNVLWGLVNIWLIFGIGFSTFTLNRKPCTAEPKKCKQSKPLISTRKCFFKSCARNGKINDLWLQCLEILICSMLHFIFKSSRAAPVEQDGGAGEDCLSNK